LWRTTGPRHGLERLHEQGLRGLQLLGGLDEREQHTELRLRTGPQDRAELSRERRWVSKRERKAARLDPGQERRRLVGAEIERANSRKSPLERRQRGRERTDVLVLARPVRRFEEGELGPQQADAFGSRCEARGD